MAQLSSYEAFLSAAIWPGSSTNVTIARGICINRSTVLYK